MSQSTEQKRRVSGFTAYRWAAFFGLILASFMLASPAPAAGPSKTDFNHQSTGFPLTGAHAQTECQTCHVRGLFKGTPKQCDLCHTQGSLRASTAKPPNHLQTTSFCNQCHASTATWSGARFSHAEVKPGTCATCHGVSATGKPTTGHVATTASCDSCHRTSAWIPASGGALPSGHRPVVASASCSTCHVGGASAFTHPNVASGCASCHNGINARAKTSNAIHNFAGTNNCETCHRNTSSFLGALFSHTSVIPGSCLNCHNGSNPPAVGKPTAGHVVTAAVCDTCHRTTAWIPASSDALPSGHRPVVAGAVCSACHVGGASAFRHPTVSTGCASCHNGINARAKTSNAIHNFAGTNNCETCHRNTASFLGAVFSHTSVTPGSCINCHNGSSPPARGKPTTGHVTTAAACDTCHRTTAWIPATFSHSGAGIAGNCISCHNGTTATGKNAKPNHIVTSLQCDACHRTTAWLPSTFNHATVTTVGVCNTCHNGSSATGKPNTALHAQTNAQCDACHRTTAWRPAPVNHALVNATNNCSSCHNGSNPPAVGKSGAHFITQRQCDQCHASTATWTTVRHTHVSAAYYTHNSAVTCRGCHTGNNEVIAFRFAVHKPACAACHGSDFKADSHIKITTPKTNYTVAELKNCAGSCHEYASSALTTITRTRNSQHRATDGGF